MFQSLQEGNNELSKVRRDGIFLAGSKKAPPLEVNLSLFFLPLTYFLQHLIAPLRISLTMGTCESTLAESGTCPTTAFGGVPCFVQPDRVSCSETCPTGFGPNGTRKRQCPHVMIVGERADMSHAAGCAPHFQLLPTAVSYVRLSMPTLRNVPVQRRRNALAPPSRATARTTSSRQRPTADASPVVARLAVAPFRTRVSRNGSRESPSGHAS